MIEFGFCIHDVSFRHPCEECRKPPFERKCPDCANTFIVDSSYSDDAYYGHVDNDKDCVCPTCFESFNGLTIEEILS